MTLTARIHEECQLIRGGDWSTTDIGTWLDHFERYLAAQTTLDRQTEPAPTVESDSAPTNPQVATGIREHGDAFLAFLQLPDVQQHDDDLLKNFQDFYIGSFASMRELLDQLTERTKGMVAITKAAEDWGLDEFITFNEAGLAEAARTTWDIVEHQGRLHVFAK